jgi:hypothetical protein
MARVGGRRPPLDENPEPTCHGAPTPLPRRPHSAPQTDMRRFEMTRAVKVPPQVAGDEHSARIVTKYVRIIVTMSGLS